MTLHQLRIFTSVAKLLNVTKASADLHISQPSVSHQLKLLEEEYGVRFYKKNARGVELTEEGKAFSEDAEAILGQVERLKQKFTSFRNGQSSASLKIGGSYGPSASFLPSLLTAFKALHPGAKMTLRTNTSLVLEKLVQNGDLELAVITRCTYSSSLIYEPYRDDELVLFSSLKYPWQRRHRLTLRELAETPLVIFRNGKGGGSAKILRQIQARGYEPNIVTCCESAEAVKAIVQAGTGLGILYNGYLITDLRAGRLRKIEVSELDFKVETFIIYPKGQLLSPGAQDFLTLLRRCPEKGALKVL